MSAKMVALLLPCVLCVCTALAAAEENLGGASKPVISLAEQDGEQRFEIHGLTSEMLEALRSKNLNRDQWQDVFSVRIADPSTDLPALLGEHRIEGDALLFVPRFGLRPGKKYEARLQLEKLPAFPADWEAQLVQQFQIEDRVASRDVAKIVAIYPTADQLPENQLKFYVHFSCSMSRGDAYRHIRLLDENDKEVEFAFLQLPEELWDPELKRFTLFFDPGRIKRGLKPREEFGPSIVEGKSYTLVIEETWPDADGRPLTEGMRKTFRVVAPDDTQPDPARWQLVTPAGGTRSPLKIQFDEPLDHAMLHRVLYVTDSSGAKVPGEIETTGEEMVWRFTPTEPWRGGKYDLVIAMSLEDLAGNSIARPFEVDLFDQVEGTVSTSITRLAFDVKP